MVIQVDTERKIYYQILPENEVSWRTQNKIHWLLNESYESFSTSFLAKTYSKTPPNQRLLLFMQDELIGHLGLFERYLISEKNKIPFLGIGLLVVSVGKKNQGFGALLLKCGLDEIKKQNTDFAVGITNNPIMIKISEKFGTKVYKSKLIADEDTTTKNNDSVVFYPLTSNNEIIKTIDSARINNEFRITGGTIF
jgi:hypothetical protein